MKKQDKVMVIGVIGLVLIVCVGGGFVVRQMLLNQTVDAIEDNTAEAVNAVTIKDGSVKLPDGMDVSDLEGVSPEVLALIIADHSETKNIIADMGKHDVAQVVDYGKSVQWAGAASDFSRAIIVLGILGIMVVGVLAGMYFANKKKGAQG